MCLKNYVQTCNGKELTSNCVAVYYLMSGTSRIFVFHHIYPQHNLHIQLVGIITNATLITYIDYSITENYRVAQKERIAFQRCPLAPTLIRFICLRFLSLGLPQIKSLRSKTSYSRRSESFRSRRNCNCATRNVSKCDAEL